jgi:hypothetical protein
MVLRNEFSGQYDVSGESDRCLRPRRTVATRCSAAASHSNCTIETSIGRPQLQFAVDRRVLPNRSESPRCPSPVNRRSALFETDVELGHDERIHLRVSGMLCRRDDTAALDGSWHRSIAVRRKQGSHLRAEVAMPPRRVDLILACVLCR